MDAQNKINMQKRLQNKTHNRKVSDKHCKRMILAQNK